MERERSPVGGIVVAKLDRLSRRVKGALEIFARVEQAGGQVACVDPPIDSVKGLVDLQPRGLIL